MKIKYLTNILNLLQKNAQIITMINKLLKIFNKIHLKMNQKNFNIKNIQSKIKLRLFKT